MAHLVGHYKPKELYINDFFERKAMNEVMEAELIKLDPKTDNSAVTEDPNVDESIPIDLRKEQST